MGIKEYHTFLKDSDDGCSVTLQKYLFNIADNKHLNAFTEVYTDECIERAKQLDAKRKNGEPLKKLHGVIIALKDVISYKDHQLTASSNILKGFTSIYNATAVGRLLAEDAIIIGNCNCDEFAMGSTNENSCYGNVLNAQDITRVPGGSSGGSAVAVQADLCMISLGSDTGGSVRQPADFCGIIGLKPGYGRISRYGLIAYASSFDQIGIFGNTVEDVGIVLNVISGEDDFDSTVSNNPVPELDLNESNLNKKKYRIAYFKNALEHSSLDPEIRESFLTLRDKLKLDGHYVEMIDFDLLSYIVPTYYVLTTAEASSNLSRYDGIRYGSNSPGSECDLTQFYTKTRTTGFGREVKRRIMLGTFVLSSGYYDAYYSKAQQIRKLLVVSTVNIFKKYDAIVMPTVPKPAYKIGEMMKDPIEMYLADIYTVYANLTGIPAISIPLFKHSNGLPFGAQIMTNRYNELTLLEISDLLLTGFKGNE